jgi:hypothetical protein
MPGYLVRGERDLIVRSITPVDNWLKSVDNRVFLWIKGWIRASGNNRAGDNYLK